MLASSSRILESTVSNDAVRQWRRSSVSRAPIHERGLLSQPDLVVLADDTLLSDPAAQPLAGADATTVLLINTTKDEAAV